jgi:hypothetical protein
MTSGIALVWSSLLIQAEQVPSIAVLFFDILELANRIVRRMQLAAAPGSGKPSIMAFF